MKTAKQLYFHIVCCLRIFFFLVIAFFCKCMFSHSNCKQSDGCVLLSCLFTANQPRNDTRRGPNQNPADPVKCGCETVLLRHTISVVRNRREGDSSHSISSSARGPVLGTNTPRRCWCRGYSDMYTSDAGSSLWRWHTGKSRSFQFVLVFLIGKIIATLCCDGDNLSPLPLRLLVLNTNPEQSETSLEVSTRHAWH